MAFAVPSFLFALFALSIPVLIHLINLRRYKRIWFTNVRFLSEIKQESRKRSQLRQWILLVLRMLTIISLVLAFSRPYVPSPLQTDREHLQQGVSIYIDNSFSMEAEGREGRLIETAKAKAREIAGIYQPSDRFQLLTNDFEAAHQHLVSKDEFLKMLEEVKISPASRRISEVISRQKDILSEAPDLGRSIYLLSDFQVSLFDRENLSPDTATSFFILSLVANRAGNIYIDTMSFASPVQQPDQLSHLHVKIRNTGTERLEKIPVKLILRNRQRAVSTASLEPRSEAEVILSFTNDNEGIVTGYVELQDYPVTFDDRRFLSYPLVTSVSVMCINGEEENPYLNALYGHDSAFSFVNADMSGLNYASFHNYSLIILNQLHELPSGLSQELLRYAKAGGTLIIIFPAETARGDYSDFLFSLNLPSPAEPDTSLLRLSTIRVESQVFMDVFEPDALGHIEIPADADLPLVRLHYPIPVTSGSEIEPLLILQNGDPLLARVRSGKGDIYLLTSPLEQEYSGFPAHLLFVPTFYKIALLSQPGTNLYYFTASGKAIEIPSDTLSDDMVYRIVNDMEQFDIIPELRFVNGRVLLYPHDQIKLAGIYSVRQGAQTVSEIAFNYPRSESDLSCLPSGEIQEAFQKRGIRHITILPDDKPSLSKKINEAERGTPLWKLFIFLSLLFLAAEILLIRLFPGH